MPAKKKPTPTEETVAAGLTAEDQAAENFAASPPEPAPVTAENLDAVTPEAPLAIADWSAPEILALQDHWPERKEPRTLCVKLTDAEMAHAGEELADALDKSDTVKSDAKSFADDAKAQIEKLTETTRKLRGVIRRKSKEVPVECRWLYNTAGIAADGSIVIDPDKRTLVRSDTGAVVEVQRIPDMDRQMPLPLEEGDGLAFDDDAPASDSTVTPDPEFHSDEFNAGVAARRAGTPRHKYSYERNSPALQEWKDGYDEEDERLAEAA